PNFGRKESYEQKITMTPQKIRTKYVRTYRLGMSVFKHKKVRPGEIVRLLFTILAMTNSSRLSNKAPVQQSSRVGEIEIYRGDEGGVVGKLWVIVLLHITSRFLDDQEKNDRKSVKIEIFEEKTKINKYYIMRLQNRFKYILVN
ncbi:hypothetical protein ALC56_11865, partial [Trachymyrmex septentrionalis]